MQFLRGFEPTWREPTQERSRERIAAILAAARELIAEGGLSNLKMARLGERAGVPVGTIYQFFPDKDAVIGRIFAMQMEDSLEQVYRACNPGHRLEAPAETMVSIMTAKYRDWRADPVMAEIWSIAHAHRTLHGLTVAASRATVDIKAKALLPLLRPGVTEARLRRVLFMVSDLYDAALRAALDFPQEEAELLMDEYATMVRGHIAGLLGPEPRPAGI